MIMIALQYVLCHWIIFTSSDTESALNGPMTGASPEMVRKLRTGSAFYDSQCFRAFALDYCEVVSHGIGQLATKVNSTARRCVESRGQ